VQGQGAAVNWRNVMTAIAQQVVQAFLKLAVLNPLLNSLFGGKRDTIGGIFDELNNVTPGKTTTESSGGGGIFGTILSLAAKVAGLFGGGGAFSAGATGAAGVAESASAIAGTGSGASFGSNFSLNAMHTGGIVGAANDNPTRLIPAQTVAGAPRFHTGLNADEMVAVLQRGERVLTARQDHALRAVLTGMSEQLAQFKATGTDGMPRFHNGGMGGGDFSSIMRQGQQALEFAASPASVAGGGDPHITITNTIDARGATQEAANSFRRSLPQMATLMADQMAKAKSRNG